jgi:hypothetical protein
MLLHRLVLGFLFFPLIWGGRVTLFCHYAHADVCASVKIEILQEATFERSAFEARMKIKNALGDSLEKFRIDLSIKDSYGNDAYLDFFVKLQSITGIDTIDGTQDISPDSESEIRWLMIPSPGAGGTQTEGKTYQVGAMASYAWQGQHEVVTITPDTILVLPQPELFLDYFIPHQVYGDDPFTPEKEPPLAYSLGVRVKNNGSGIATNLRIDTGKPEIVDNEQGLKIEFHIIGSEVNGDTGANSFRVDFGSIDPGACSNARWKMISSLSGKFIAFTTSFTHDDELGGQLTSLIQDTNGHLLIHEVVVDLPGRDGIHDFLANVDDSPSSPIKVYESDCQEQEMGVENLSDQANMTTHGEKWKIYCPEHQGGGYIKIEDPTRGTRMLSSMVRSDEQQIRSENVWLSKEYILATHTWSHYVNVFDINLTGEYLLTFGGPLVPDSDEDGMQDAWEQQIIDADPDIKDIDGVKPEDDFDKDGETNLEEYKNGTDPTDASSTTRGDVNGDKTITLADAILALRILNLRDTSSSNISVSGEINGDHAIGLPEAAYALQSLSELKKSSIRDAAEIQSLKPGIASAETVMFEIENLVSNHSAFAMNQYQIIKENGIGNAPFYALDEEQITDSMMTLTASVGYLAGDGYEAVELPSDNQKFSMVILLPKDGRFEEVETSITADELSLKMDGLEQKNVQLRMPMFQSSSISLGTIFAKMGIPIIFKNDTGTKTAAAIIGDIALAPSPIEVNINWPFLFFIRDLETRTILLTGGIKSSGE